MTYANRHTRPAIINGNGPKRQPGIDYEVESINDDDYRPLPGLSGYKGITRARLERLPGEIDKIKGRR